MKNLKLIWLVLLTIFCVGNIFGQRTKTLKPNFSGTWKLDIDKSTFNENFSKYFKRNEPLICLGQLRIIHKEPKLKIKESVYCYTKDKPETKINEINIEDGIFYTDARGEKNNVPDYMISSTKTKWSGNSIVLRNELSKSFINEYYLSEDKKILTKKTYNPSNGNQTLVYYLSSN
ncbi:MAG: hypothetical protein AAB336_01655 [Acidobacteriota bacterium]